MVRPEVEIDRFAVGRQTVVFHFDLLFGNRDERIGIVVVAGREEGARQQQQGGRRPDYYVFEIHCYSDFELIAVSCAELSRSSRCRDTSGNSLFAGGHTGIPLLRRADGDTGRSSHAVEFHAHRRPISRSGRVSWPRFRGRNCR